MIKKIIVFLFMFFLVACTPHYVVHRVIIDSHSIEPVTFFSDVEGMVEKEGYRFESSVPDKKNPESVEYFKKKNIKGRKYFSEDGAEVWILSYGGGDKYEVKYVRYFSENDLDRKEKLLSSDKQRAERLLSFLKTYFSDKTLKLKTQTSF